MKVFVVLRTCQEGDFGLLILGIPPIDVYSDPDQAVREAMTLRSVPSLGIDVDGYDVVTVQSKGLTVPVNLDNSVPHMLQLLEEENSLQFFFFNPSEAGAKPYSNILFVQEVIERA